MRKRPKWRFYARFNNWTFSFFPGCGVRGFLPIRSLNHRWFEHSLIQCWSRMSWDHRCNLRLWFRKGVAGGVVDKTSLWKFCHGFDSRRRLQASCCKQLFGEKRDYKSSLQQLSKDSLQIPPPTKATACHAVLHTYQPHKHTYLPNKQTSKLPYVGSPAKTNCSVCFIGSLCHIRSMSLIM